MIQVLDSCILCDNEPSYGMKLPKVIDHCYKHKTDAMITFSMMSKFCVEVNCPTSATYNYIGLKPAFCIADSSRGMVNVINTMCNHCGTRRATLSDMREVGKPKLYCAKHCIPEKRNADAIVVEPVTVVTDKG